MEDRFSGNTSQAVAVVKLLAGSSSEPKVAMRGSSMSPLLREPMVLKLGPSGSGDRVGDILVFENNGQLIAHRITRLSGGVVQTCGDAVPWSPEYPELTAIVGKVVAVLADDSAGAPRVDTWLFRLRGAYNGRLRALRALPFRMRLAVRRGVRALPWFRPRPYVALIQAIAASLNKNTSAFERALRSVEPSALTAAARRHGCSATLLEAVCASGSTIPAATYIRRTLQDTGRKVVLRGIAVRSQIASVVGMLGQAQIPFALLKGAARLYRDDDDATLHASSDLDILVPADRLDDAAAVLRANGYHERADEQRQRNYREHHHHAAPLFPPENGCAIELHVALAPPGWFSIPLDWAALQSHLTKVSGPAGDAQTLDDVGSALHYAVHAVGSRLLRDSLLLAKLLARMQRRDLDELRSIVAAERIDPIRLAAAVVLAARMAGVAWPASGPQEEYLRWCMRREDMPIFFGWRSQLAEGWYGADRHFGALAWRLVDPRSGLGPTPGNKPASVALLGRGAASACAFLYASAMRQWRG